MKNSLIILLTTALIFIACDKDNENGGDPSQQLVFESLVADRYTLHAGESTRIKATASGYRISYHWSASAGDILNSGAEVIYAPSPCHAGENQITCEVKDGNNKSLTKTICIVVE
ncbi:MAG: PKD domain-containing protein [Bacteroidales bacterium]|nr:PKD domain-containing protein [Bacteroidales bacterium]